MAGNARSLGSVSSTNGNRWTHLKEGRGNVTQKMPLQSECHRVPQASERPAMPLSLPPETTNPFIQSSGCESTVAALTIKGLRPEGLYAFKAIPRRVVSSRWA